MSRYNNSSRYIPRDDRRDPRDDRRDPRDDYYGDFKAERGDGGSRGMHDDSKAPITHPSICIPRTFPTIRGEQTKRAVFNTIKSLRIGYIERIDTVHKTDKNGERYCTVYIHMKWDMSNSLARDTRQKLLQNEEIKIVYDDPWFWKCTMSTIDKPENRYSEGHKHRESARPRIDLGEGTQALSRYTEERGENYEKNQYHQFEEHNQQQLCNMDPEDED
jgi:hypothetical protein